MISSYSKEIGICYSVRSELLIELFKKIVYLNIICLIIVFCISKSYAFGTKYAGEFLKIGVGVREISLGGAAVASPQSVSAIYWNPAALSLNTRFSGQFMHTEEFAGVLNLDHISIVLPAKGEFAYGLGFFRIGIDDIPDTRNALIDTDDDGRLDEGERLDFSKIGKFGASESALFLSAAKRLNNKLHIGSSVKFIYKSLGTAYCWGVGLDAAMLYSVTPHWSIGAALHDVTTTFLFWGDGEREVILPSVNIGTAYKFAFPYFPIHFQPSLALDISMEGEQHNTNLALGLLGIRARLGMEAQIKEHIVLRFGRDDLGSLHIGLGLDTSMGSIDYGFAMGGTYQILGQSHRLGITLHFLEFAKGIKRWL